MLTLDELVSRLDASGARLDVNTESLGRIVGVLETVEVNVALDVMPDDDYRRACKAAMAPIESRDDFVYVLEAGDVVTVR